MKSCNFHFIYQNLIEKTIDMINIDIIQFFFKSINFWKKFRCFFFNKTQWNKMRMKSLNDEIIYFYYFLYICNFNLLIIIIIYYLLFIICYYLIIIVHYSHLIYAYFLRVSLLSSLLKNIITLIVLVLVYHASSKIFNGSVLSFIKLSFNYVCFLKIIMKSLIHSFFLLSNYMPN